MNNYYVSIDGKQTGPHPMEEIKSMNLSDKDLIWNENSPTWVSAAEFQEFRGIVRITPPPLPSKKFNESKAINKALVDSLLPFIMILLISFIAFNGFASREALKQSYPLWVNIDESEIREYILIMSLIMSIIPSLIVLIIDYRIRINREISRLTI